MDYNEKAAQAYKSEDDFLISKKELHDALKETMNEHLNQNEIKEMLDIIVSNLKRSYK